MQKNIEILQEAKKNNIQIIGEVEFAYRFSNLELIAILELMGKQLQLVVYTKYYQRNLML